MTESTPPSPWLAVVDQRSRGWRYLAMGLLGNAVLWGSIFVLVKEAPRIYSSQWSLIFLGRGTKANVNLPNIGSASAQAESPFNRENDVKASYKMIATTDSVRQSAAAKLGMTKDQFGQPHADVVEGTPLMNLSLTGSTPEEAQKKAYALQEAFQERLGQLRVQQATEQEIGFESSLGLARRKLDMAQRQLSDYKVVSGLTSKNQLDQLATNIEELRKLRAEISAQQQDSMARSQQLSTNLNTSSPAIAEALALRADPLFQRYIQESSDATARLTTALSKFGPNHPVVIQAQATQETVQAALQARAEILLGHPADAKVLARLNLGSNAQAPTARESLFQEVVKTTAEHQGLTARTQELSRQIAGLEERLSYLAQGSSNLEALNRNMQIAEAVFSSTLAGLDASKSDLFGAYPPVQIVVEPSLSKTVIVPQEAAFVHGGAIGSVFLSFGLLGLWLRKTAPVQKWLTRRV